MLTFLLDRRQRNDPVPVYLLLAAGQALCFSLFFTINLIFQVTVIGLDPFQMVLVGTVLEVTCFLFEVPTGIVADVYSRRLSILIGVVLISCAYALAGGVPAFWAALAGQVFWGIGYTFTSGATQAWITDEIGEDAVGPVFLRGEQMWLIGGLAGTLLCVPLALINVQLPMILAGVGMAVLAVSLFLIMPERYMRPASPAERSTFSQMTATARDGFRQAVERPVVRVTILISLIVGLGSEVFDRLSTPSVIGRFEFPVLFGADDPVIWFGLSGVVGTLLGLASAEWFKRHNPAALDRGAPARLLAGFAAVDVVALVIFAVVGNLWLAFAMLWVRGVVRTISGPVEEAWLNRNVDSASRATVNSMTGQANAIGQAVGGPALGWVGAAVSVQAALLSGAAVLAPTVALWRRLVVREPHTVEPVPTVAD